MKKIKISITHGNAYEIPADIIVLKYAQALYGLDKGIVNQLADKGLTIRNRLPAQGRSYLTESHQVTNARNILFIGTPPLIHFRYREIRTFGGNVLSTLADVDPAAEVILLTTHGAGFGLDETEAFESLLAGLLDSISKEQHPKNLNEIIFAEQDRGRAERLKIVLNRIFPENIIKDHKTRTINNKTLTNAAAEMLQMAGHKSSSKRNVFVAMPFAEEFDDHFHYGIQGAVNASGYLCERADLSSFTGDVMEWVKSRISSADFIIADLTTANPNVYLEIGYAWGLNKKTILLIKDPKDLRFNTQGQRCLSYSSIKEMETKLRNEISALTI
jgi:hypothetical protein